MSGASLPLRDIHLDAAPPWWPPAPGWWMLGAALLLVASVLWLWWWRRRRQRRALEALFEHHLAAATTPVAQVAAMSELLRRAARRVQADADQLSDAQWRSLLAGGAPATRIAGGQADLLLQGGYRRDADAAEVAALRRLARARFLEWMSGGRR